VEVVHASQERVLPVVFHRARAAPPGLLWRLRSHQTNTPARIFPGRSVVEARAVPGRGTVPGGATGV
jgi:hypothetical protein